LESDRFDISLLYWSLYYNVLLCVLTDDQFKKFSWDNCGKPDAPITVKTLHVYPNPIPSPGYILAPALVTTSIDLLSPLPVSCNIVLRICSYCLLWSIMYQLLLFYIKN